MLLARGVGAPSLESRLVVELYICIVLHRFIDGSFLPGRLGNQQQRYAVAEKHFRNEMQRIRNVGRDIIKYLEKQVDPRMPP